MRMSVSSVLTILAIFAYGLEAGLRPAMASMLDKAACDQLKIEQTQLGPKKLRDAMEKGPDWARTNLSQSEFDLVRTYIELEEALLFRCPRPKPVRDETAAKSDARPEEADDAVKAAPVVKKAPRRDGGEPKKTEPAKKAEPARKPAAPPPSNAAEADPKPKPKPRPAAARPNDAFVPPPKRPVDE